MKTDMSLLCDECVLTCEICGGKMCSRHSNKGSLRRKHSSDVTIGNVCDECLLKGVVMVNVVKRLKTGE